MNPHYQAAVVALREADRLGIATEGTDMAAMQTRATLSVAAEQAKTNQHFELANAQLCKANGDGAAFIDAMEDVRRVRGAGAPGPGDDGF